MLLTADIGNSSVSFAFFSEDGLICHRIRLGSDPVRTSDEYASLLQGALTLSPLQRDDVTDAIVSSVVPALTHTVQESLRKLFPSISKVQTVGPGMRTGFSIKTDNPSEVGADIVANTAYAVKVFDCPLVIADFGTMTVLTLVGPGKEMLGNVILPGIGTMFRTMPEYSALLPGLSADETAEESFPLCGTNTPDSIRSGIIRGQAYAVDGYVDAFEKLVKAKLFCISTGGYASIAAPLCRHAFKIDPDLTAKGLFTLFHLPPKVAKSKS